MDGHKNLFIWIQAKPIEVRIKDALSRMTVEEKVAVCMVLACWLKLNYQIKIWIC
jgi:hypothetical protein